MSTGKLYLFPSLMAPCEPGDVLPRRNLELLVQTRYFVVEELRSARRFLKACDRSIDIDSLHFSVLNEHTPAGEVDAMLAPVFEGHDVGVISEAGRGVQVVPLVGPSSILMALMASGFNGQSFAFAGYLPIDAARRAAAFKEMERNVRRGQTQIFIETPYRNSRMIAELAAALPPDMLLCVACDITGQNESIRTMPLKKWRTDKTDYAKRPAIFLLYR